MEINFQRSFFNMFICQNCKKRVNTDIIIGTKNRNHCPYCLYSVHLDEKIPGDRMSNCKGLMEPIGLKQKRMKTDKYGKSVGGELMLVHRCNKCGVISTNRIAGDDSETKLIEVFEKCLANENLKNDNFLKECDREEVKRQLFGS